MRYVANVYYHKEALYDMWNQHSSRKKELLIYHFGCYSNLVTIATKYVADAIHPKKASYQI